MSSLHTHFNDAKVHKVLAGVLPDGWVDIIHCDRYSLAESDGIVTQVRTTTGLHLGDPDVAAYLDIDPADAGVWDPSKPGNLAVAVAAAAERTGIAAHGATWVRGRDVHPNCQHNDAVAALVLMGRTLFVRATTSAVKRAIKRADGPDENAYTALMSQLVRNYDPRLLRFDEDTTRAARDDLSSDQLVDVCISRGTHVQFGAGQELDPQDPLQRQLLSIQLGFGTVDDVFRRRKLMGKRVQKLRAGGAPMGERQMPHGYRHARTDFGERVKVDGRGYEPVADWAFVPHLQELVRMHAAGLSYTEIGLRMASLGIKRRGQQRKGVPTLAELAAAGDRIALADAAKSFFVNTTAKPASETGLYLQKIHLWRTGEYRTRVNNEIRGRGISVAGLTPTYRDTADEYGYFEIAVRWPWPIHPTSGQPLVAWDVAAELERCEDRLLAEIRSPRPTGGAAHQRPNRRALSPNGWTDGDHVYGVTPRRSGAGNKKNTCIVFRNTAEGRGNRRGWSIERADPQTYAVATFPLTDLCGSAAATIERASLRLIDASNLAPVTDMAAMHEPKIDEHRIRNLEQRIKDAQVAEDELRSDAQGQELLAGRRLAAGDTDAADRIDRRAQELTRKADVNATTRARLERELLTLTTETKPPAETDVSLNLPAYLIAGLRRASTNNGIAPARFADLVAKHVVDWRMQCDPDNVRWTATLLLPIIGEGDHRVPLSGVVDNTRSATGGRSATSGDTLAEQIFVEGRTVEDLVASTNLPTSRRALIVCHLMPWLKQHGITNRTACCAIVDHPVLEARQLVFGHLSKTETEPRRTWPRQLSEHITSTLTNAELSWGFAACPDDIVAVQRIVTAVADHPDGVRIDDIALAIGWTYEQVRELARPYDRAHGFTRPKYLELRPNGVIGAIACPHCHKRSCVADRVVLLPEIARSGYGVLAACGRAPVGKDDANHRFWNRLAFPDCYTDRLFSRIADSSLRDEPQTGAVADPPPLRARRGKSV